MPQIEAFESADLPDVDVLLRPLIHTVCLIWANSRYYSTPGRIVVLLQEICNMFIQTVRSQGCTETQSHTRQTVHCAV